jgi:hypothetical protein
MSRCVPGAARQRTFDVQSVPFFEANWALSLSVSEFNRHARSTDSPQGPEFVVKCTRVSERTPVVVSGLRKICRGQLKS